MDMGSLAGYAALLDYRYWLNPYPVPLGPSLVLKAVVFFGWFLAVAIVLYVAAHAFRKKDGLLAGLLRRFAAPLLRTGLLGWLFLFFTYEQSPFLGMRFWFLALTLLFLYWIARAVFYAVKEFPVLRAELRTKLDFERWLPKPHHK